MMAWAFLFVLAVLAGAMGGAGFAIVLLWRGGSRLRGWADEIDALIAQERADREARDAG